MAAKNKRAKEKCKRKQTFGDKLAADNAAHQMFRTKGERVFGYRCRLCNKYHFGHRSGRYVPTRLQ